MSGDAQHVFLLFHIHKLSEEEDDAKLIGVYSSLRQAELAQARAMTLPGFKDHPDGFQIDEYTVDENQWTEGFVTVGRADIPRLVPERATEAEPLANDVAAALQQLLHSSESVSHWRRSGDEEIDVFLITEAAAERARIKEAIGLPGGSGRVLTLKRVAGKWTLVGEAHWIA